MSASAVLTWLCAALGASTLLGCTHDFGTFAVGDAGAAPTDSGSKDSSAPDARADSGLPGDSGGSCAVMCGGQCASSCSACAQGHYACGSQCVSSCAQCNGGTDFVVCVVCPDGGAPQNVCGPADPNGFCLNGNYPHCPCSQDSDCGSSNMNQRCSNNVCTACGEPQFSHNGCQGGGGACCKSPGPNFGTCGC